MFNQIQNFKIILSLIILYGLITIPFNNGHNQDKILDCEINKVIDDLKIVGVDIAVVKDNSIIFNKSYGYRNLQPNIKYKEDDICWIGSISKTFVATAIMQLVDQNKINLNDDAQDYLKFALRNPKFPKVPITIKMLLSHLSSINDAGNWYSYDFINPSKNPSYSEYYMNYKPGAGYKYCNYNYNILASIVENVSGKRFDDYVESNITKPIGMIGNFNCNRLDSSKFVTVYHFNDTALIKSNVPYKSYKYHLIENYKIGETTGLLYPAAGMKTSAHELAKYMLMHINNGEWNDNQIISKESENKMRTIVSGTQNYGLSFREYKNLIQGTVLYGQTGGGTLGEKTAMIFNPTDKYGFVIITNGSKSQYIDGYGDIHKNLIKILYKYLIK